MATKNKSNEKDNVREENKVDETKKDPVVKDEGNSTFSNIVAALLALLFVGVAGYYIYSYFGDSINLNLRDLFTFDRQEQQEDFDFDTTPENDNEQKDGDILTNSDVRDDTNNTGNVAGDNSSDSVFAQWIANDYVEGDIEKGDYTVKEGDTLWELAEGAYGDAYQWETILNQNIDDVGFLPNGQQALIYPNQVLRI